MKKEIKREVDEKALRRIKESRTGNEIANKIYPTELFRIAQVTTQDQEYEPNFEKDEIKTKREKRKSETPIAHPEAKKLKKEKVDIKMESKESLDSFSEHKSDEKREKRKKREKERHSDRRESKGIVCYQFLFKFISLI